METFVCFGFAVNFGLSMLALVYAIAMGLGPVGLPMSGVLCPLATWK